MCTRIRPVDDKQVFGWKVVALIDGKYYPPYRIPRNMYGAFSKINKAKDVKEGIHAFKTKADALLELQDWGYGITTTDIETYPVVIRKVLLRGMIYEGTHTVLGQNILCWEATECEFTNGIHE